MRIAFITDVDIGAQFYLISNAINKYTKHKARCVVIARNYLLHPYDIWLGTFITASGEKQVLLREKADEVLKQAEEVIKDADFYVFRRYYFFTNWTKQLTPNNHLMVLYGSEARMNPGYYHYLWMKQDVTLVTHYDYTMSSLVGFSVQHIPTCLDLYLVPKRKKVSDRVRVCHSPTNRQYKDTDLFLKAMEKIENCDTVLIENEPWSKCLEIKSTCDICYDQLRSGAYGMSAIESMAMKQPVVCYVSGWTKSMFPDCPIVNAKPDTLEKVLSKLVKDEELRECLGEQGYRFVKRNHDVRRVVRKWVSLIKFVAEEKKKVHV